MSSRDFTAFLEGESLSYEIRAMMLGGVFVLGLVGVALMALQLCSPTRRCLRLLLCNLGAARRTRALAAETALRRERRIDKSPGIIDSLLSPWEKPWMAAELRLGESERLRRAMASVREREKLVARKEKEMAREEKRLRAQLRLLERRLRQEIELLQAQQQVSPSRRRTRTETIAKKFDPALKAILGGAFDEEIGGGPRAQHREALAAPAQRGEAHRQRAGGAVCACAVDARRLRLSLRHRGAPALDPSHAILRAPRNACVDLIPRGVHTNPQGPAGVCVASSWNPAYPQDPIGTFVVLHRADAHVAADSTQNKAFADGINPVSSFFSHLLACILTATIASVVTAIVVPTIVSAIITNSIAATVVITNVTTPNAANIVSTVVSNPKAAAVASTATVAAPGTTISSRHPVGHHARSSRFAGTLVAAAVAGLEFPALVASASSEARASSGHRQRP